MTHTEGPWDKRKVIDDHVIIGTQKKPVAEICMLYENESDANARLIAAAPELLEIVKRFAEHGYQKPMSIQEGELMDAAWATIAKAEGEGGTPS